jgi:ABC-type multidrug transport system fused ATPase/permease subunit
MRLVIRSGARAGQIVDVDAPIVVGRSDGDLLLADDPLVSARHARLVPRSDGSLLVEDLGSTNGTLHNDQPLRGAALVRQGDRLGLGDTVLELVDGASPEAPSAHGGFAELRTENGTIAYRRGTVGASVASEVALAFTAACQNLGPLIAITDRLAPRIVLADPFPDPAAPGHMLTRGSVVDATRCEVWLVVSAESPLEPLERPLALLLGARLPAGAELSPLLEGYGLCAGRAPDPAAFLRESELPSLASAEGDLASAMTRSFVGFLLARVGEEAFLGFLAQARPGQLDQSARVAFGDTMGGLERTWRAAIMGQAGVLSTRRFIRLAWSYLRPYRRRELELFVLSLLSLSFMVALPFALESLLNHAIPSGKFEEVAELLAILAIAMTVSLVASWRQNYQATYVGGSIVRDVRLAMFERLQQLDLGWYAARHSGDVLTRLISDVDLLELGASESLHQGAVQLLTFVVAGITALIINVWLGLVTVLAAPLIGLLYRMMSAGAQRRSLEMQQRLGAVAAIASENLAAQPVVKAFGLEQRERSRLRGACDTVFGSVLRLNLFTGMFTVSVEMVTTLVAVLALGLGAWLIIHHHFTVGGLVAFTAILDRVLMPATALAGIGAQIQASSGALIRIGEVLDVAPRTAEKFDAVTLPRLQGSLELRDVSFSYSPDRRALSGISATIPAGSRVAFVGPSGSGKSSIVQLLLRLADPDLGAVLLDGVDVRRATLQSLRGQIGVVLQQTFLFNGSIRENIGLGRPDASESDIERAAHAASLDELARSLPDGLETNVGERGGQLSGGQAQRVAIARALVRDPAILVLDEATSALDPRTEREVGETVARAGAGRTTIAVTHRLASVRDYDRIFVVSEGRIVEQGAHAELVAAGGVYAGLWDEQTSAIAPVSGDIRGDLARLPLFADLAPDELTLVSDALVPLALRQGERLTESNDRLVVVAHGSCRVLVPGIGTEGLVRVAELRAGQAFGLSALLGEPTGSVLEAGGEVSLLCLDGDALERLGQRLPSVAAALHGNQRTVVSPVRGKRLEFSGSFAVQRTAVLQATNR